MKRAVFAVAMLLASLPARAQTAGAPLPAATEPPPASAALPDLPAVPDLVVASPGGVWPALGNEARRYGRDTIGLLTAPLSWDRSDREKAAAFAVVLGSLLLADRSINEQGIESRSSTTHSVSNATEPFGSTGGFAVAASLIAAGLVFHSPGTRDTGRDALEAAVIAGLIDTAVKRIAGRERPITSNGETTFEPGSSNASFASGHATVAFAVASVIAARSPGWIVPGLAYTAAALVGFDRINSQAHFASDVFAGAVLGTVTGRWLVHRHEAEDDGRSASIDLMPDAHGLSARIRF